MSFLSLVVRNVMTRRVRAGLTGLAVAIAIMTVVALGVLTHSLRRTAVSVLRTGTADFTVAQKGVSDVLYSNLDEGQVNTLRSYPQVDSVVGVLVAAVKLDANHPFFLELGIQPNELAPFGVQILRGQAYSPTATDQVMLGWRASSDLQKGVGDTINIDGNNFRVVGIFSTGQVFGDSASMLPLPALQGYERKPGAVTLAFVKTKPGANIAALRKRIEKDSPEMATVKTESDFGRVDRNLSLISAANVGITILALVIGAIGVMNTMVMSVFERTREFGVLRAVGWTRARLIALVMSEALLISLVGAAVGVALGFIAIKGIQRVPALVGVFQPNYPAGIFGRALGLAVGMAFVGALYPAIRAALLVPMDALRHE
ncbi:MAG: ABC transporter permease [Dehalococcoidia bacterium]|nr:ABC transporter permease [Dehalococcoidia bacterium]